MERRTLRRAKQTGDRACVGVILSRSSLCLAAGTAEAWTGAPSPHDAAHLVVVKAADFRTASGKHWPVVEQAGALARQSTEITGRAGETAHASCRRVYAVDPRQRTVCPSGTLHVALSDRKAELLAATLPSGDGSVEKGGRLGYEAYDTPPTRPERPVDRISWRIPANLGPPRERTLPRSTTIWRRKSNWPRARSPS